MFRFTNVTSSLYLEFGLISPSHVCMCSVYAYRGTQVHACTYARELIRQIITMRSKNLTHDDRCARSISTASFGLCRYGTGQY